MWRRTIDTEHLWSRVAIDRQLARLETHCLHSRVGMPGLRHWATVSMSDKGNLRGSFDTVGAQEGKHFYAVTRVQSIALVKADKVNRMEAGC